MSLKPKSLESIEHKMEGMEPDSIRFHILKSAKDFKTSWVELGQSLYSVWKDKLYRGWGFSTFDIYTTKEIGIKKPTAMKLLRSYFFLEKEEPGYLKKEYRESSEAAAVPNLDSINVLRLAKTKNLLDEKDYSDFKKKVFEKGRDGVELKKDLTALIRQRRELSPEDARAERKTATLKRFLSTLKSLKMEVENSKFLPVNIMKGIEQLIEEIESEIN
ncbi:MAG: hypothetical protein PHN57_08165 [Candidatus Omnitrophica bacterium]|nr:hypothetical protein [Candidatus Omnitrophota bacterium]